MTNKSIIRPIIGIGVKNDCHNYSSEVVVHIKKP